CSKSKCSSAPNRPATWLTFSLAASESACTRWIVVPNSFTWTSVPVVPDDMHAVSRSAGAPASIHPPRRLLPPPAAIPLVPTVVSVARDPAAGSACARGSPQRSVVVGPPVDFALVFGTANGRIKDRGGRRIGEFGRAERAPAGRSGAGKS